MQLNKVVILSVSLLSCQLQGMGYIRPYTFWFGQTITSLAKKPLYIFEHHNIAYQKQFDKKWQEVFAKEIDTNPIAAAKKFKDALDKNPYTSSHKYTLSHKFLLGLSSSAYQFEGGIGEESSWHRFAVRNNKTLPGKAIDFWNQYPKIIQEMK